MMLTIVVVCLLVVVLPLLLYVWYMSSTHGLFKRMGIDGPKPWPVFGTMLEGLAQDSLFDYYSTMYQKYKKVKVYGVYRARLPSMVVCDLDMIRDICVKQFHNFTNRQTWDLDPPLGLSMLELKDDHWRRVRNAVSPSFSTGKLRKMQPHIERNTRRLIDHLKDKQERNEPVELRDMLSAYTMDVIASLGFGFESNSLKDGENQFTKAGQDLLNSSGRLIFIGLFVNFLRPLLKLFGVRIHDKAATSFFTGFIDRALEARKTGQTSGRSDFIQIMLDAEVEQDGEGSSVNAKDAGEGQTSESKRVLSRDDIIGQALIFLLGGYDTVATVLSTTMFVIAMHPECLEKVQEEIDRELGGKFPDNDSVQSLYYLEMCMNEAMRIYPPGFIIDRWCDRDTEIGGVKIPRGISVTIPVIAIHRDPDLWPEPEKFDPERFTPENKANRHPYAFMPFGQGPRNCIGMRLAILEVKVALAATLQHLVPVRCDKTVYPMNLEKLQIKAKEGLWVKFESRK